MTSSIDQAFQKAYAQRIPSLDHDGAAASNADPSSAIWIDEESGKTFRNDAAQSIGGMHAAPQRPSQPSSGSSQSSGPHGTSTPVKTPGPSEPIVRDGTTAYEAWSERLATAEFALRRAASSFSSGHDAQGESSTSSNQFTHSHAPAHAEYAGSGDDRLAARGPFVPTWEVDEFNIPSVSATLIDEHLESIGMQLHRASSEGLHSLAVSSLNRASGTSTFAIAIAQVAASTGLSVALVDADTQSPALADLLQLELDSDWFDAIQRGGSIASSAVVSLQNKVCFIPLFAKSPEQLKNVDRYATKMFEELSPHFDLIVVDFGPLQNPAFGLSLPLTEELFDAVVMVEDMRSADYETLQSTARRIRAVGIENIGLIENFAT